LKPGELKIVQALASSKDGSTFTEIEENTKLSHTAIAKYLDTLETLGVIHKDYSSRRYVLAAIYKPIKDLKNEWQKWLKLSAVTFLKEGQQISEIKQRAERVEGLRRFLEFAFNHLALATWEIIGESLVDYENDPSKVNNPRLADSRIARINDAVQNWLIGLADSIAVTLAWNLDIYKEVAEPIWNRKLRELEGLIKALDK